MQIPSIKDFSSFNTTNVYSNDINPIQLSKLTNNFHIKVYILENYLLVARLDLSPARVVVI